MDLAALFYIDRNEKVDNDDPRSLTITFTRGFVKILPKTR
jgi:hypothetical protein